MMMFSSAMSSSSYGNVVPRNRQSSTLSGINLYTATVFSSFRSFQNLPSYLFVSLMKILRMSSHCSTSFARPRSLTLLISAAYAELLFDVFLTERFRVYQVADPARLGCFCRTC